MRTDINITGRVSLTPQESEKLKELVQNTPVGKSFDVGRQGSIYTVTKTGDNTLRVTQTEQSRIGTISNKLKSLFGDRLSGSERLAKQLGNLDQVTVHVQKKSSDPIQAALLLDSEKEGVSEDVKAAMLKLKPAIKQWAISDEKVAKALHEPGRDAWVYNNHDKKATLEKHLNQWNESWSAERTCGLLLDLGLALRYETTELKLKKTELLNTIMQRSRQAGHKIDKQSKWATEFTPKGTKMQSGVSATTANLLCTLRHLNKHVIPKSRVSDQEIEALMIGVVNYWKDGSTLKKLTGNYHTPAEVWSSYTRHLEIVREQGSHAKPSHLT